MEFLDSLLAFIGKVEEIVEAIFKLVDGIMDKVDEYTAEDAE